MNIVLIGPMGAGKTTVAKELAAKLGMSFVDLDLLIVDQLNMSVVEVFKKYGEKYFRKIEHKVLKSLVVNNTVIATGGGIIELVENHKILFKLGQIFYLETPVHVQLSRIKEDNSGNLNRGLLQNKALNEEVLVNLYKKRNPCYLNLANWVVNTETLNIEQVVSSIIKIYQKITLVAYE